MVSAIGLFGALIVAIGVGGVASIVATVDSSDAALAVPILGLAGSMAVTILLATCLPGVLTGIGLLYYKPWARILGIVLCAIQLVNLPLGTVFGAYGLWVLLSRNSERLFSRPAAA